MTKEEFAELKKKELEKKDEELNELAKECIKKIFFKDGKDRYIKGRYSLLYKEAKKMLGQSFEETHDWVSQASLRHRWIRYDYDINMWYVTEEFEP